jgi:hypothetical protein
MASIISLNALWEQAFTTALSPARKRRTAAFGFHAGTKTVLMFPCSFGRLVSPFHKTAKTSAGLGAVKLGMTTALSIGRGRSRCSDFIRRLPATPIFEISGANK